MTSAAATIATSSPMTTVSAAIARRRRDGLTLRRGEYSAARRVPWGPSGAGGRGGEGARIGVLGGPSGLIFIRGGASERLGAAVWPAAAPTRARRDTPPA